MNIDKAGASQKHLVAGYGVMTVLSQARSFDEAAPALICTIADALEWDAGIFWKRDPDAQLRAYATWATDEVRARPFMDASRAMSYAPGEGMIGGAWQTRMPASAIDLANEPRYRLSRTATQVGYHAAHAFPIVLGNESQAVLEFLSATPRAADSDLLRTMATIGFQIAQFIERIRATQELRRERDNLHRVFEHAPAAIAIVRVPEYRYELSNPANRALAGGRDMVGLTVDEALPEFEAQGFKALLAETVRTGNTFVGTEIPITLQAPDKSARQFYLNGMYQPIFDEDGKVNAIFAFAYDVTIQVEARRQAEEARLSLERVADTVPQIIYASTPDGKIEFINRRGYEYTGLSADSDVTENWHKICHPDDLPRLLELSRTCYETGAELEIEIRLLRASDHSYRWHLSRAIPLRNVKGEIIKWIGSSTDIDDHKRAEEATRFMSEASSVLNASLDYEATLKSLAAIAVPRMADWCSIHLAKDGESTLEQLAVMHRDPSKIEWAREFDRRYPPDPTEPGGIYAVVQTGKAELYQISDELLAARFKDAEMLRLLRALGMSSVMLVPLRAHGRVFGTISFVAAESGRHYNQHDLAIAQDFADRAAIAIENAILYNEAQEAVKARDDFLSVASHELRTPLTSLELQIETMRRVILKSGEIPSPTHIASKLEVIERQVDRLTGLVNDLLDVSRAVAGRFALEFETVDLAEVATDAVARFKEQAQRAGCELALKSEPCAGQWDKLRLDQIVTNLVSNAIKFGPGKPIDIQIRPDADHAVLTVRDYGIGIEPADQARIFERFERAVSKRHFGGLGLGLWIVRQIVESLDGSITVTSKPGLGSEFTVRLPQYKVPDADEIPNTRSALH